jgi:aminopeptidase N
LRPELTLTPDGVVLSLAVLQQPPPDQERASVAGALRTHRLAIGLYKREDNRLHRRRLVAAEVEGARTVVSELEGTPAPDAIIVNDGDLTFATIRFDDRSFRALVACAMDVGDPLAEAVCWNAVWDMTAAAELGVSQFTDLVVRRIASGNPPVGVAELLEHAVNGADYYAAPARRLELRERLATAALTGAERAQPGSRDQRAFAMGFAASAQSASQLDRMRSWLSVTSLPEGVTLDLELRGQILATLSARDLTNDDDLDAFAREDPVGGETQGATCRALRPYSAAKEVAWVAALAGREGPRMAQAHARGIWAPGQEDILVPWRDRYFSEALSAASDHEPRTAQRLGRLLYPATLADSATIAATDAALERGKLGDSLRIVLIEQRAILQQRLAARAADSADEGRPQPCDGFGEQTGIC